MKKLDLMARTESRRSSSKVADSILAESFDGLDGRNNHEFYTLTCVRKFKDVLELFNRAVETCNFDPLTLIQFSNSFLHLTL